MSYWFLWSLGSGMQEVCEWRLEQPGALVVCRQGPGEAAQVTGAG